MNSKGLTLVLQGIKNLLLNEAKSSSYISQRLIPNNEKREYENCNLNWEKYKSYTKVLFGIGVSYTLWKSTKLKNKEKIEFFFNKPNVNAASPPRPTSRRDKFNFIAETVRICLPAVVSIEQYQNVPRFVKGDGKLLTQNGSGFFVDSKGLIITNWHVVERKDFVTVQLHDGRRFEGRVIAFDETLDLAAVQINASDLPYLNLADSEDVMAGEWAIAMGSPLSLYNTVTAGIVSNMKRSGRDLGLHRKNQGMHYVQTDATIDSGNSGGPLINLDGEVIGVNTMMAGKGIAFAIPSLYIKDFLRRLQDEKLRSNNRQTARPRRRYIGIAMLTLTPEVVVKIRMLNPTLPQSLDRGVYIHKVTANSPAHIAGLQTGDVIVEANRTEINDVQALNKALHEYPSVTLKVVRGNQILQITVHPENVE